MTQLSKILTFVALTICSIAFGQKGISFAHITIEAATQRANIENKNIFVDSYAPWCGPCKIMDKHFKDPEIVNYFNSNFINVKVDTDTKYGKVVSAKYGIAFLPTILILDKDGVTRFKVDKLISKVELLSLAKYAIDGPRYPKPSAPIAASKPSIPRPSTAKKTESKIAQKVKPVVVDDANEKILYVLDPNATDLPPEILYEESYFRMQLNDGSHKETAEKYLATQEDWLSEKNIKFIFDFLYNTDSDEFKFFIKNKEAFSQYIDQDKIERSLKILVEDKLYQGIPRPSYEQSKQLLALIDKDNATKNNFHYFLNRLYTEGNENDFSTLAEEYFKSFDRFNQEITINYISNKFEGSLNKSKVKSMAGLLSKIEDPSQDYNFLLCHAKIYLAQSEKANAISYANKAIEIAKEEKIDSKEAVKILETIKEL